LTQNEGVYQIISGDNYSRELFAAILHDKTSYSAKRFLEQVIKENAFTIET